MSSMVGCYPSALSVHVRSTQMPNNGAYLSTLGTYYKVGRSNFSSISRLFFKSTAQLNDAVSSLCYHTGEKNVVGPGG